MPAIKPGPLSLPLSTSPITMYTLHIAHTAQSTLHKVNCTIHIAPSVLHISHTAQSSLHIGHTAQSALLIWRAAYQRQLNTWASLHKPLENHSWYERLLNQNHAAKTKHFLDALASQEEISVLTPWSDWLSLLSDQPIWAWDPNWDPVQQQIWGLIRQRFKDLIRELDFQSLAVVQVCPAVQASLIDCSVHDVF